MKGSELMQTAVSDTKNVAPAMRPVSITLKAGEWELVLARCRAFAPTETNPHFLIDLEAKLAKAGVY